MSVPPRALTRSATQLAPPPARIVHIGLGAFHRAHQAWYTSRAADAADWGIAAFAGRSADLADRLASQDGLFTLVERDEAGDRFEIVDSIVSVRRGVDVRDLVTAIGDVRSSILTLTVTEAGYGLTPSGVPDWSGTPLEADVELAARARREGRLAQVSPITVLARVAVGLELRRASGGGPLAIVPCDNFPSNGSVLRRALREVASGVAPGLPEWMSSHVSFVSTSVDRITPRVEHDLSVAVAEHTGWIDQAPVATEPFSDWTLAGEFPGERPAWETSGARFVDDIEAYESRKLWLLNGAHSLLAYLGLLRGHTTVAEAFADRVCVAAVERWWNEACRHLPSAMDLADYRSDLARRFRNPRIEHALAQISQDGTTKIGLRIVPVAHAELRAGRDAVGARTAISAWIAATLCDVSSTDARSAEVDRARVADDPCRALLAVVAPDLAAIPLVAAEIASDAARLASEFDSDRGFSRRSVLAHDNV